MRKLINEFKEFALRGNVIDLAVGVIIGAAFQNIVSSLTDDIISPLIGLIAKTDFKDLVLTVFGVNIKYGSFITAVINFFIMAIVLFALIKLMNKAASLGKHEEAPAARIALPFSTKTTDFLSLRTFPANPSDFFRSGLLLLKSFEQTAFPPCIFRAIGLFYISTH